MFGESYIPPEARGESSPEDASFERQALPGQEVRDQVSEISETEDKPKLLIEDPKFERYTRGIFINGGRQIKQMVAEGRMTEEQAYEAKEEVKRARAAFNAEELNNPDLVEVISKYPSTAENSAKAKLDKVTDKMLDTDSFTEEGREFAQKSGLKITELRADYEKEISDRTKLFRELREITPEQIEKAKYNRAFEGLLSEIEKLEGSAKVMALNDLALDRARIGRFDQIDQLINTLADVRQKDQFCVDLIDSFIREGNIPYANLEKIAGNIADSGLKKEWTEKIAEVKLQTIASGLNRVASGQNIEAERKQLGMDLRGNLDKISKSPQMQAMSAEYGSAAGWISQQAQDKDRALELLGIKLVGMFKHGAEKLGLNKTSTQGKAALAGFGLMWLFCFSIEKGIQLIKYSMEKAGVKFPQYAKRAIEGQGKKQAA
ncbi:MAG: hypothetical protein A3A97_00380 [Candidatus Terrybacteria bacterium RIFCSPLOWO2_01_FULL_40_23]|uniref:Uncharacterized protein n=1 Tax=Candidatus Terrybacteria bacterium RIFCSPLOWO2_01_FULL_40_23 TaxID=1802366 RepID=A0A1G2PU78_9BACT|nr:MAG: hypothetical protein A3A97_00380 [Candidatus Terrybacteria bacterium RIFCSPLOWO2_01_FULL_40_23]